MEASLAVKLSVSGKEVDAMVAKVNRLVKIKIYTELTEEQQEQLFNEGVTIATRLKKGYEMITQMEKANPPDLKHNVKYNNLYNLYQFLAAIQNLYDVFFKTRFPLNHYNRYHETIAEIIS
jgi:hypothetical protein